MPFSLVEYIATVKLIASVQLESNEAAFAALHDTLQEANCCANWLSEQDWKLRRSASFEIHKLFYEASAGATP